MGGCSSKDANDPQVTVTPRMRRGDSDYNANSGTGRVDHHEITSDSDDQAVGNVTASPQLPGLRQNVFSATPPESDGPEKGIGLPKPEFVPRLIRERRSTPGPVQQLQRVVKRVHSVPAPLQPVASSRHSTNSDRLKPSVEDKNNPPKATPTAPVSAFQKNLRHYEQTILGAQPKSVKELKEANKMRGHAGPRQTVTQADVGTKIVEHTDFINAQNNIKQTTRRLAHLEQYQHSSPVPLALFLMMFFIVGMVVLRFTRSSAEPKKRSRKATAMKTEGRNSRSL